VAGRIRHANSRAELAERQLYTSALVEGSPDAIIVADATGRLMVFNQAAEELTGWQRDDVLGKPLPEVIFPEEDRPAVVAAMQAYLESGDTGPFVNRVRVPILRADGTRITVEVTPVVITIGTEVHFCGFLRDISEMEQAQAALEESESRFRLLAQLAPVGIVQADLTGKYTFANVRMCELTGLTMTEALGASWPAGMHPDDVGRLEQEWAESTAEGRVMLSETRLAPSGGSEVWALFEVIPIPDADGSICGFLAAVTDVSDRKRAEAEREALLTAERAARRDLADQTERLNSLIATAPDGILISDENGQIAQLNASFCALFGIEDAHDQLIGTPVTQLLLRVKDMFADPGEFVRRTGASFTARRPTRWEEIPCADGRTFECDFWPVLVDGDNRGNMWLIWDTSPRKALADERERLLAAELAARAAAERAQAVLTEQNAKLQALDEAKTQFLATMSHEVRTPLTSVVAFTELILDDTEQALTPDTASSLAVIQRNAKRLLSLVGDLLLLSRLEAGVIPLDLAAVSLPELLGDVTRSASAVAAEHDITLQLSAMAGPPVQADLLRLEEVFDNLLANAIKFSGPGGQVRVTATHDEKMWQVVVADDGIGVPADELGSLFGRFVRASNARVAGLPGTGLGLSVVKAITELHGGSVAVQSTVGLGTTFTICLPVGDERQGG